MMFDVKRLLYFSAALLLLFSARSSVQADERPRNIVLLAGKLDGSHPAGTHEYEKTVLALKEMLEQSTVALDVQVTAHFNGWPEDEKILDEADTILLVSNGGDRNEEDHPLLAGNRWEVLRRQMNRGCGLILLHWSTFIPDKHQDDILEWTGGYFDYQEGPGPTDWYSRIQHATAIVRPGDEEHPLCQGIHPYRLTDEYYYRIRFRDGDQRVRPILKVPLEGEAEEQVVAWAVERADGGRGFTFTGCHFLNSLELPGFRRMLLNALAWTARVEVPEGGVALDSERPVKAIIVTGHQHPAHVWRETTLALEDELRKDPRLQVESVPDPNFLAEPRLHDYDVVIINYCNWEDPEGIKPAAKENFLRYLNQGGGLVIVHFSNGAFHFSLPQAGQSDWPEWRTKICRRVWDHTPGKSGHDAFGKFRVQFSDAAHPITSGLESFETTDELYFRQQGDEPIQVLATAHSQVTNEVEPMAFVYRYGAARVFQTVLGHAAESIRNEGTAELLRRGTAWAAGRRPLAAKKEPATPPLAEGRFGQALDARRGHVQIEHRDAYDTFPLTVECWVQVYDKTGFQIFAAKNPKSSAKHWEIYSYAGTGEVSAYLPGYRPAEIKSGVQVTDGQWHHVAMTFDGRRLRLYVDGELAKQEFLERAADGGDTGPLWIGAYEIDRLGCQGLIDDVRISKVARDMELPQAAANADDDTIGLWSFDEVHETSVKDSSTTANPAVLKLSSAEPITSESILTTEDHFEGFEEQQVVDDRWQQMETGRFFSATIGLPEGPTWKGIVVRVGDQREVSVCYDTELLRVSGAWTGFLKFSPNRFGLIEMPSAANKPFLSNARVPGWAREGSFDDPRPRTPYGVLPENWARYRGLHVHGERVVIEYRAGDMDVWESPWVEHIEGEQVLTRSLQLGPSADEQRVLLCAGTNLQIAAAPATTNVRIEQRDGHSLAIIPAHQDRQSVKFFFAPAALQPSKLAQLTATAAADDLREWLAPGPPRWTTPITTRGQLGTGTGAFVVDTITLPYDNPYQALMFTSAHDFFSNGDAAVATVHGDVWRVSGIDQSLAEVHWKRMATGLFQPLGLKVINDQVYVTCRDQITVLHDLNEDGEADFYQSLNNEGQVSANGHEYVTNLEQDSQGWLYFLKGDSGGITDHDGTMLRVSADGKQFQVFATGIRNGNGLGMGPGDIITASPQEGNWTPASSILEVHEGGFYGMMQVHHRAVPPATYDPPLCWIPRTLDNSSGSQTWIPQNHWGPLGGGLLHFSFGRCRMLLVLREVIDNQAQAAVVPFPVEFLSGAMRGRFSPHDGHLYVTGLRGWVTSAVQDGSLQRVRYTNQPTYLPTQISTHANGVAIRFAAPLDRASAEAVSNYSIERWNYRWSAEYGSADYRPSDPRRRGHDPVLVRTATLLDDGQTVFLEIPDMLPVMQMNITYTLTAEDGTELHSALVQTIHRLRSAHLVPEHQQAAADDGQPGQEVLEKLRPGLSTRVVKALVNDSFPSRMAAWTNQHANATHARLTPGEWYQCESQGWLKVATRDRYQFKVRGRGAADVYIDGLRVLAASGDDLSRFRSAAIPLSAGYHQLAIHYAGPAEGEGQFQLRWLSDQFLEETVPPEYLFSEQDNRWLKNNQARRAGARLAKSFRCAQCHEANQPATGPVLQAVGSRLNLPWLYHWLLSPHQLRTQATMPALLHGGTRAADARDLTKFLLSQQQAAIESPATKAADAANGQFLFESLGCMGCHTFESPDRGDDYQRHSLYFAKAKFAPGALATFLAQPAAHYEHTKMPDFHLSEAEANDLAAFIVATSVGELPAVNLQAANAERGGQLFRSLRCSHCHQFSPQDPVAVDRLPITNETAGNCLGDIAERPTGVPDYQLNEEQRGALQFFWELPTRNWELRESATELIQTLRCAACHDRDGIDAVLPVVLAEEGALGLIPEKLPSLTWTGEKLQAPWVEKLLRGDLGYRTRPWLKTRMPAFPFYARQLAEGFAIEHGLPFDEPAATRPLTPDRHQLVEALLEKSGLDCRQCHARAGELLDLKNESQGIGLSFMGQRLRRDYYDRWMMNPLRIDPATKMPQFSSDGRTTAARHLAGGDARQQFDAIWDYLHELHSAAGEQ